MFSTAAWVLDQEYKAFNWLVTGKPKQKFSPGEQLFLGAAASGWVAGHGYIAAQPYLRISHFANEMDLFVRTSNVRNRVPIGFTRGNAGWVARFAPRAGKMLVTRGLTRAIPYIGWGLLAYDLWNLGKWIGSKTDDPIEYFLPTS